MKHEQPKEINDEMNQVINQLQDHNLKLKEVYAQIDE